MGFQLSPGVNVTEKDLTTIVPAVQTTAGGFVGAFQWGPVDQRVLVDSEANLVSLFGKPDETVYVDFFTASNFLGYGNNLQVVRAIDSTGDPISTLLVTDGEGQRFTTGGTIKAFDAAGTATAVGTVLTGTANDMLVDVNSGSFAPADKLYEISGGAWIHLTTIDQELTDAVTLSVTGTQTAITAYGIGGATETMSGILGEGGTEYLQAFAQNSINYGLREGWGKNPDEVLKVMGEAVAHASMAGETFEEAYAGGVLGAAFGGVSGVSTGLQSVAAKSAEEWNESKVVELKEELRSRGLVVSGNKDVLVKRLMDDDVERYNLDETDIEIRSSVEPEPEVSVDDKAPVKETTPVEPVGESKDLLSSHINNLIDPTSPPPVLPSEEEAKNDPVAQTIIRSKSLRSQGLRILDLVKRHPETLKQLSKLPDGQKSLILKLMKRILKVF